MQIVTKNNLENFTKKLLENDKVVKDQVVGIAKGIEYTDNEDAFYITDAQGNIIFKADKDGVSGIGLSGGGSSTSSASSPYSGRKMITIGDSLSAHDKWQKWVVEWTGMTFDNDENINGKYGYKPMAKGGTAVFPDSADSVYMRAFDAQHYNPDVIFLYAGQNDIPQFGTDTNVQDDHVGTIDDKPYKLTKIYTEATVDEKATYTSWYEGRPTLYSSFKGLLENILEQNPSALVKIITPMQMWTDDGKQSLGRAKLVEVWEAIGEKYGVDVINLWKISGVTPVNASSYYPSSGNVHPNDYGYKRIAETICSRM